MDGTSDMASASIYGPGLTRLGHERVTLAAVHGSDLLYSVLLLSLRDKAVKWREFITLLGSAVGCMHKIPRDM